MVGLFDFLTPADRAQAAYQGLTGLGTALMQAGAPSTTPRGPLGAAGLGLGGFGSAYQNALNSTLAQRVTGLQAARLQNRVDQEEQVRQAQARIAARVRGQPNMAMNPQVASAAGGATGLTPSFDLASASKDPAFFSDLVAANGGNPLPVIAALQRDDSLVPVAPGASLVNRRTGQPVYTNPRSDRPAETETLMRLAGIDPGSPEGQRIVRAILAHKGEPPTTTVNNNQLGNIPPGYQLIQTPNGGYRMEPIPGSPAAKAVEKEGKADQTKTEQQQRTTDIVTQDIDRALGILKEHPNTVAGMGGSVLSNLPGTNARDFAALVATVKANAGFDRLQAMRNASPTGGALGNVSEPEIAFLQAAIGNLEQSQSPEQLADNLRRVKNIYLDIVHGPGQGPPREKLSFKEKSGPDINALSQKYGITPTR